MSRLDSYLKLCGKEPMQNERGPVVYAALVTASFLLAWLTLFSFERFGQYEVRAWSPLIQGVLSALAIFSAWWLQNRSRQAQRRDSTADNVALAKEVSALFEWDAAFACEQIAEGLGDKAFAAVNATGLRASDNLLRKVDLPKIPTEAIGPLLGMLQKADEITAKLEYAASTMPDGHKLHKETLIKVYANFFHARSMFLKSVNIEPELRRKAPEEIGVRQVDRREVAVDG